MTPENIGVVFGPTLMRPDMLAMASGLDKYNTAVKVMVESWTEISRITDKYKYGKCRRQIKQVNK